MILVERSDRLLVMLLSLLFFVSLSLAQEKQIRVVVLDTGLNLSDRRFKHLCKEGHEDFTETGLNDNTGHGTFVAGLIEKYAKNTNYCLIILKYYDYNSSKLKNVLSLERAYNKIAVLKPDIVNYSGGGKGQNVSELEVIRNNPNIKFIVAAGNDAVNIDEKPYYPASYRFPNVISVGALNKNKCASFSNYGNSVVNWEQGVDIKSYLPENKEGYMSGTSMSTAIHTGKYIYEKFHR